MTPGEVYARIKPRGVQSGGYYPVEAVGDRILIEEAPLPQGNAPEQARAAFLSGNRSGQKVQWAIRYIEDDFRLVPDGE